MADARLSGTHALPSRLGLMLWSGVRRRRIRLQQWAIAAGIYVASGVILGLGVAQGLVPLRPWAGWVAFVIAALLAFYGLQRGGWSERLHDPALTAPQIVFGVFAVAGGYLMCGELRSACIFPLMLILSFGAFSLSWQRMALLTGFALAVLGAAMLALHRLEPGRFDARVDVANFLAAAVIVPAGSLLAVRLSALRARLRQQRRELEAALVRIQALATQDALTGLVNRRQMQALLDLEQRRVERSGESFCLALIDLDHFKRVNDDHGHAAGDAVLRGFAAAALPLLRASDVLARWGGEEFMLLMPASQLPEACAALERVREHLRDMRFERLGAARRITLSAGIVQAQPGDAPAGLIERADEALYRAKSQGRDRVVAAGTKAVGLASCGLATGT